MSNIPNSYRSACTAAIFGLTGPLLGQIVVTDHPESSGSNPYLPSTDAPDYITGYEVIDQRFGLDGAVDGSGDPTEELTQSFTLVEGFALHSIFISYNDSRAGGVIRVSLDYGDDGSVDFTQDVTLVAMTAGAAGGTAGRTDPQNWLELDFSAEGLTLPAGINSYSIGGVSEEAGSSSFMFAPQYHGSPSGYADGEMSLNFASATGDAAFGISGTVVPEPSIALLGGLGLFGLLRRRRS